MKNLVRKATILAVCGLLYSGVAIANVPDPANCECNNVGTATLGLVSPKAIVYVGGNAGGVPDPVTEFCVVVRDFNNVPIENSSVVLDFFECTDVQLCTDQLDPGVIVDCVGRTVRKLTDPTGTVCFRVMGKSYQGLGCVGAPKDCFKVYADSRLLCTGDAPILDLINNPGDGLLPGDLSEFLKLWLVCGTNASRGNYNVSDQLLLPGDLSIFLKLWLVNADSPSNCVGAKSGVGPKCP